METINALAGPLGQRLTWTLLHFLWQGAVLAGLLESAIYQCGVRSLTARYRLALAALMLMAACPIVTFHFVQPAPLIADMRPPPQIERTMPPDLPAAGPQIMLDPRESTAGERVGCVARSRDRAVRSARTSAASRNAPVSSSVLHAPYTLSALARWQPWLLGGWAIGAGLLALRLLIGGGMAWRMRLARRPLDPEWADRARRLALRLGVRRAAVFVSARVRQAVVAGVWRPMVLLPAAWLAEMPPEMLEGVLAHELAHLRRLDLWAILLQRLVETFLFYHPAVWWLSRRLSREREMCCDEMAVAATGDRLAFTEALQWAAQRPAAGVGLVLGAAWKGSQKMVIERIRRLLGADVPRERFSWWPLGLAALLVPALLMFSALSAKEAPPADKPSDRTPTLAEIAKANDAAWAAIRSVDMEFEMKSSLNIRGKSLPELRYPGLRWSKQGERERFHGRLGDFSLQKNDMNDIEKSIQVDVQVRDDYSDGKNKYWWTSDDRYPPSVQGAVYEGKTFDFSSFWLSLRYVMVPDKDGISCPTLAKLIASGGVTIRCKQTSKDGDALWVLEVNNPILDDADKKNPSLTRIYVNADKGFLISRVERRLSRSEAASQPNAADDHDVIEVVKFTECGHGVFFPSTIKWQGVMLNNSGKPVPGVAFTETFSATRISVNVPLPGDAFDFRFPEHAIVRQCTSGKTTGEVAIWGPDNKPAKEFATEKAFDEFQKQERAEKARGHAEPEHDSNKPAGLPFGAGGPPLPPRHFPAAAQRPQEEAGAALSGVGTSSEAGLVGSVTIVAQNFDWRNGPPRPSANVGTATLGEKPLFQEVIVVGNETYKASVLKNEAGVNASVAADPTAVENGRRKIEKYYLDHGYSKVRVTVLEGNKTGDHHVIYTVDEGPRQRVLWVNFVGNTFVSAARLKTLIESDALKSYLSSGEFDAKKLDEDVNKLTAYYRSFGFFHARIGREVEFDEKQDCATVIFVIDEGPRYTVGNVYFLGNHKLDNARLAAKLKPLSGQPFDQNQQTLDLQKLRDEYASEGYVFAKVEAVYRFLEEPGKLNIVYNIEEGDKYHIGRMNIEIKGENPHTMITTVPNRLSVKPGDVVDVREIRKGGGPLKAAQLFNGVGVNPDAGLVGDIMLVDRAEPKIVPSARDTAPAAKPAPPASLPTPAAAAAMVEVKVAVLEVDRAKLQASDAELQRLGVDLDKLPADLAADSQDAVLAALSRDGLGRVLAAPRIVAAIGNKAFIEVGRTAFDILPTVVDKDRVRLECHLRLSPEKGTNVVVANDGFKLVARTLEINSPLDVWLGRTRVVPGVRLQSADGEKQIVLVLTAKHYDGKVSESPRAASGIDTASADYRIAPPDVIRIEVTRFPGGKSVLEGLHLVGPDGTINLREYGVPNVAGLTAREVERRIVNAVSRKESGGEYSARVEVASNNSKVVYVIFSAKDDRVVRVPADHSTTVASALLQVEGAAAQAAKETVWLARPRRNSATSASEIEIKEIDWPAIVQRGSVEANLRLLPGDRIFIGRRPPEGGVGSTGFQVLEFVGPEGATFFARYARLSYSQANDQMIFEGDGQSDAALYKHGQDGALLPFKAQKIIYFKKTGEVIVNGFHSLAIPKANEPPTKAPAAKAAEKDQPFVQGFDKDDSRR